MEYSVEKSDLQTSVEKKIEELQLAVAQYVIMTTHCENGSALPSSCNWKPVYMCIYHDCLH